jgi:hypothetical protein
MKFDVVANYEDDESVTIYVNGKEVANANHDEHGWAGIVGIVQAFKKTAKVLNGTFKITEGSVDDE